MGLYKATERIAHKLAKWLHIPLGAAVILAIILTPKIVAVAAVIWYMIGSWIAKYWDDESATEELLEDLANGVGGG